jgi:Spermidine/putrescine-binding periplasmic protein
LAAVRRGRMTAARALAAIAAGLALAACGGPGGPVTTGTMAREAPPRTAPSPSGSPSPTPRPAASPTPKATPAPTPTSLGRGEGMVRVLAPRGYVEYGGTDPNVNWVTSFERETGCRVRLTYAERGAAIERMLADDGYDVVAAPPEVAGRLITERRVAPLRTSLLAHYRDVPRWLRELPAYTARGAAGDEVYGVPYLWAYHQVAYDRSAGGADTPKDGGALFREPGPVLLRDDPLTIADAALALRGEGRPEDPFRLTPDQLDAAVALLAGRKEEDRSYWRSSLDVVRGFAAGRLRLAQALPYQVGVLARADRPVRAVTPRRTTGWADAWLVTADAAHPNCAYRWIGHMLSRDVQREAAEWNGLAPANLKACTGRARRVCADYRVDDPDLARRVAFAVRPARDCGDGEAGCTDYAEWERRWRELVR